MIVLNEKEYAEECLKNNNIGESPFFTLSVIAKYYYHILGYKKKKIMTLLTDFLSKNYPRYDGNKSDWDNTIERIASGVGKYALYEIDGIWITQSELNTIESIHNKVLERLAFTLLCLAKLNNIKNPKNNGWVNLDAKEVFTLARITCNVTERYERLNQLYQLSLLEFPKKNDNLSSRVTYISDDSEKVLFVSDFRELGYEYLKYTGKNYIRCQDCGILIKGNKYGNKKYCSNCAGYTPIKSKRIICIDCGEEFESNAKATKTCRCNYCQNVRNRQYAQNRVRKFRDNKQM